MSKVERHDAWSERELAVLREVYPPQGPAAVAALIGRTLNAVRARAWALKLRRIRAPRVAVEQPVRDRLPPKELARRMEPHLREPAIICARCRSTKPAPSFHHVTGSPTGRARVCKTCVNAKKHQNYPNNPRQKRWET